MKKEKKKEHENDESFIQQVASLPRPLQVRFLKHIGTAIAMLVLTVFMVIYFQTWSYGICSLISLYIAYLGCDIVWSSQSEKIICRKMVCVKANKVLRQDTPAFLRQSQNGYDCAVQVYAGSEHLGRNGSNAV